MTTISLEKTYDIDPKYVITRTVKPIGNTCHVTIPKTWEGSKVVIIRKKEGEKEK